MTDVLANRPRVLLVAYACNPAQGSEEGVGWSWVTEIARRHEVDVITADFHREAIKTALVGRSGAGVPRFHYVAPKWWHYRPTPAWRRIEASPLKPVMNLVYGGWQRNALQQARRIHAERAIDVVHLLTYVGFRFPGRFYELDLPFVWGPIGGLENTPARLLPILGPYGAAYYAVRNAVNTVQRIVLRAPRLAMRRAGEGLIAATGGIRREIRRTYGLDATVIAEIGAEVRPGVVPPVRMAGEPLRIAWSGLHLPGKALNLLLAACRRLPSEVPWHLDVLGDGPRREVWEREAEQWGIASRVTWHGWVPRERALAVVGSAHVFVITSLKDLTSTVVLEALSLGVPVVCLDHCGFADVVTESCGIKIPVTDREGIVEGLAEATRSLDGDETRRRRLGDGALKRAREYTMEKKMAVLDRIYADKIANGPPARTHPEAKDGLQKPWRSMRMFDTRVDLVQNPQVLAAMEGWIAETPRRFHFIVNTGFHGLEVARCDPEFREIVNEADLFSPDGIATVWIARLKRQRLKERATSAELMTLFFERANEKGYRSYFLGDTEATLAALRCSLEDRWPGHRVVGTMSPPFRTLTDREDAAICDEIKRSGADVLWVGLGLPKQERWIYRNRHRLQVPVAFGVGACFGFFSGQVHRVPGWLGRTGLEWAWRFLKEPRKLWYRNLVQGPRFILHAALELSGIRRRLHHGAGERTGSET